MFQDPAADLKAIVQEQDAAEAAAARLPRYLSVTPAYGRDYHSQAALLAAFREGKDFRLHAPDGSSCYFSIRDLSRLWRDGVRTLNFRYHRATRVLPFNIPQPPRCDLPSAARRASTDQPHEEPQAPERSEDAPAQDTDVSEASRD